MSELMTEELAPELTDDAIERSLGVCAGYMLGFGMGYGESPEADSGIREEELPEEADEAETSEEAMIVEDAEDGQEAEGAEASEPEGGPSAEEDAATEGQDEGWPYGRNEVAQDRPPSRNISTKELGRRGEDAATNYLIRKGYRILERNWTCKFGEADIIAMDDDGTVVFVEVKTRRTDEAGLPEEAITAEKQRRYEKLALTYMIEAEWNDDVPLRFDAIGIFVTGDFKAILKHHKGCFDDC